ncbi:MAG: GNAT family N-acetyltransferase [Thiothrix sp.]|nr:GNAT family N-acetyltransferase [Thiothrix sp.]HPE60862.1 GNAT family N-acyltransferase [Thiolinea sp.]
MHHPPAAILSAHAHLSVELASTPEQVLESQRLRYRIFAGEQGALLENAHEGIDRDHHDDWCQHLLVRDNRSTELVGSTRILSTPDARRAGSFYSEAEFDLRTLFPHLHGNVIEIGRTCIHPDYRNGTGISLLWSGLAHFIETRQVDYLFGCASISMQDGGAQVMAIMDSLRARHLAPAELRVTPRLRVRHTPPACQVSLPPLLKAYLRLGAWIGGEPCLDPDFNVADVFILLDIRCLNPRYQRHFIHVGHQAETGYRQAA